MSDKPEPIDVPVPWAEFADQADLLPIERQTLNAMIAKSLSLQEEVTQGSWGAGFDKAGGQKIWSTLIAGWAKYITDNWELPK